MRRVDQSLKELEAQNEAGEDAAPVHLPQELSEKTALREQVRRAMKELSERSEIKQINLTDKDARLMKTRRGIAPCYNAQVMVSPTKTDAGGNGMYITALEVTDDPDDHSQRVPMLRAAEETTELRSEMTLADAGYHSGSNLRQCGLREQKVVMPEAQRRALGSPYHKDRFAYDEETDSYICPQGQRLRFTRIKRTRGMPMRLYRASGPVCRGCPEYGVCTRDGRHGRGLEIGPHDTALRRHRSWMGSDEA